MTSVYMCRLVLGADKFKVSSNQFEVRRIHYLAFSQTINLHLGAFFLLVTVFLK
jgi:hypothetical protein